MLYTGTGALESELRPMVKTVENDSQIADYVAHLLAEPPVSEPRVYLTWNWLGLQYSEFPESRLAHAREIGDRCLSVCIFYLDDLERKGQTQLLDFGQIGYRIAAMHAISLDREEGDIYAGLSERFFPTVAELSYSMMRKLGNLSPAERIIILTPFGERLVLSRSQ